MVTSAMEKSRVWTGHARGEWVAMGVQGNIESNPEGGEGDKLKEEGFIERK